MKAKKYILHTLVVISLICGINASAKDTNKNFGAISAPTIGTFSNIASNYGDPSFTLTDPTSNSTGAFSYTSSNKAVATIVGNVVTIVGAGATTITATQAATSSFTSGSKSATLTVSAIAPTFGTFSDINKNYGAAVFTLTAPKSNSTGAFSYTSSNTAVATISGSNVTIVGAGSATITAKQAATTNYKTGSITATLTVNTIAPTLGTFNNISKNYGIAPFKLTAPTSNSKGAFSYSSSNLAVATISGDTVTLVGAGSAIITATQAASGNYISGSKTATLTVAAIAPTIGTFSNIAKNYGDPSFSPTDPTSNSAGAFTYTSSNKAVATISGNIVTIVGAGTSTITATQAANGGYKSGTKTATLTVSSIAPTIGTFNDVNKNFGAAVFTLTAPISNSTGAFSYTSSNTAVATLSGNRVSIIGVGSTTITAKQAATTNYKSGSVTATLTVSPIAPTITFSNISKAYSPTAFALSPTSNSKGAFSYTSSNTAVATVSGNLVTMIGVGTTTITATQDATTNYTSGVKAATLTITQATPTISFSGITKNYGDTAFTITTPTSNSAGTFTYTSSNKAVATISGSIVTILSVGSTTITATQSATANYKVGTATATLKVNALAPTIDTFSNISKDYGDVPFTLTAPTSNSAGIFTYSSSDNSVATISGNTVTIVGAGSATITATQAASGNYTSGSTTATLLVSVAVNTWTGLNSTDWNDPANWSKGSVPTTTSGVFISNTLNNPVISGTASAYDIIVDSTGVLTNNGTLNVYRDFADTGSFVSGNGSYVVLKGSSGTLSGTDTFANLEVQGNYTVGASLDDRIFVTSKLIKTSGTLTTNNKLTLISDANSSAMIEDNGGALTGKAYIQHYTSGNVGYHQFASPISDATVSSWSNSFPIYGPDGAPSWLSSWGSLQVYNEVDNTTSLLDSSYYNYTSLSNPLVVGQGYSALLSGLTTLNTFGTPNNGAISVPVTHTSGTNDPKGWNMVGNPYPSPISWTALKALNPGLFGDDACYLWKSSGKGTEGTWSVYDGTVGVNGAGDIINSSLGFFVYVNNSGNLNFDNSVRNYHYTSPEIFGNKAQSSTLRLSIKGVDGKSTDEVVAYTSYKESFSRKMVQPPTAANATIAFDVKGTKAAINVLTSIDSKTELPITLLTPRAGVYTVSLNTKNINLPVYLKDALTGTYTDLSASATITTSTKETSGRYSLVFSKSTVDRVPLTVYPNPSKSNIVVSGSHIASIQVVDNLGKVVKTVSLKDAINPTIAVNSLPAGSYHLKVQTTDGKVSNVGIVKE